MERRYAFFPYLKTSDALRFGNIRFFNSGELEGLPQDVATSVKELAEMFFLQDHLRIKDMTAAVIEVEDEADLKAEIDSLLTFQTLLRYLYSAPHPTCGNPFLTFEHGNLFVFRDRRISPLLVRSEHHVVPESEMLSQTPTDDRGEVAGYEGMLDMRSPLWVTHGSRIYPTVPHMWLNISQDLHVDIEGRMQQSRNYELLSLYRSPSRCSELCDRLLKSLRWYNRSVAMDVPPDVALVSISIAFESLLGLPKGKQVTDRFKESVVLLLGPVPRLESFLTQFYDARSEVVHEGDASDFMFRATDSMRESDRSSASRYRPLAAYARNVFQACLLAIVRGGMAAAHMRLQPWLTTNQQRCDAICMALSASQRPPEGLLRSVADLIHDFEMYRFVSEKGLTIAQLIGASKLAVKDYLLGSPELTEDVRGRLQDLENVSVAPDAFPALDALRGSVDALKSMPHEADTQRDSPVRLLTSFLDCVWGYVFMEYFRLERQRKSDSNNPDAE